MQKASPQKTGPVLKVCIPVTNAQTKHHLMLLTMVFEESLPLLFCSISSPAFLSVEIV